MSPGRSATGNPLLRRNGGRAAGSPEPLRARISRVTPRRDEAHAPGRAKRDLYRIGHARGPPRMTPAGARVFRHHGARRWRAMTTPHLDPYGPAH